MDDLGARLALPARPKRIVSLAPSLTETAFALGAGDSVVAVSDSCDHPTEVGRLPRVGELASPSIEAVLASRPDLVLATAQGNPREVVERLRALGVPVYGVRGSRPGLDGVADEVRSVARALGREGEAERLLADMDRRLAAVRRRAAGRPRRSGCCLVWTSPLIAAGRDTFLSDLLDAVGVDNACARGDGEYPRLSREDLLLADPDVLLLATGEAPGRSSPLHWGPWAESLGAVRAGSVAELPPLVLRPTLRLAEGAEHVERVLSGLGVLSATGP